MATLEELSRALKNADQVGDTDAARALAKAIARTQNDEPQREYSAGGSALRGGLQGVSLGFADEIAALPAFLRDDMDYGDRLQEIRQSFDRARTDNTGSFMTGEIAGTVAGAFIPGMNLGAAARGASLGTRVGRGILQGAGYGGLYGAGTAEGGIGERAIGAGVGGALGAVGGAAGPVVMESVLGAGRGAASLLNKARGALDAKGRAGGLVAGTLNKAAQRGDAAFPDVLPPGAQPGQMTYQQAIDAGLPVSNIDRGGRHTRELARQMANINPDAEDILDKGIDSRWKAQADRYVDDVFSGQAAETATDALEEASKIANAPKYRVAYAKAAGDISTDPLLQRMAGTKEVQVAMREADEVWRSNQIRAGNQVGDEPIRNLEYWDIVKKRLDAARAAVMKAQDKEATSRFTGIIKQVRDRLDEIVPEYKIARGTAAEFFGSEKAIENGMAFSRSTLRQMPMERAAKEIKKLSPPDLELFRTGYKQAERDWIMDVGRSTNLTNRYTKPGVQAKLQLVFGKEAKTMEARTLAEMAMDLARTAVKGNSSTMKQLAQGGFLGGGVGLTAQSLGGGNMYNDPSVGLIGAALGAGFRVGGAKLAGRVNIEVAEQVAKMLMSQDDTLVNRGLDILQKNKVMMDGLRQFIDRATHLAVATSANPLQ